MSLKYLPGAFTHDVAGGGATTLNLADGTPSLAGMTAFQSQRTLGITRIDVSTLQPTISDRWKLLSVSFQAYLLLYQPLQSYGLLGKLIAGLILDDNPSPTASPGVVPLLPLPTDSSLATVLWDGSKDEIPPSLGTFSIPLIPAASTTLPVSGSIAPPQPKALLPGQQIGLGLWLTPSLIACPITAALNPGILVYNASYTIAYDDGS